MSGGAASLLGRARRPLVRLGAVAVAAVAALALAGAAQAAPWCGTPSAVDRPAAVAGHQIRVVYAYPADGTDGSATLAPQISADVDLIEEWWRGQDPARSPRFDRALFSCGPQVDLITLRLTRTSAELQAVQGRFSIISDAVYRSVQDTPYLKYLVYYDGPLGGNTCGQGGGTHDGKGVAIVYVAVCSGEPTAVVAAHELLHAMGALESSGPPNPCSAEDTGHPCDSSDDVLWPFATLVELTALFLDVGRDDYYDHPGDWPDVRDSQWLRRLDGQTPLSVGVRGGGVVQSNIPGVACSAPCGSEWDTGVQLTLIATPGPNQVFVRWGGACTGREPTCALALAGPTSVDALFAPPTFAVRVSVGGRGTVRSTPAGIACPGACAGQLPSYGRVRLTARAAPGWRFKGWTGACRGAGPVCVRTLDAAKRSRATFARR